MTYTRGLIVVVSYEILVKNYSSACVAVVPQLSLWQHLRCCQMFWDLITHSEHNKMLNNNWMTRQDGRRHVDGLVQERRNSSVLAMELSLSCTNPPLCTLTVIIVPADSLMLLFAQITHKMIFIIMALFLYCNTVHCLHQILLYESFKYMFGALKHLLQQIWHLFVYMFTRCWFISGGVHYFFDIKQEKGAIL